MIPALVYDIETEGWTRFVLATFHAGVAPWVERDEAEAVRTILGTAGVVVAHNGGRFDHLWLLDAMARHGLARPATARLNGAGIIELRIGQTVLRDSARLYPMSLAELTGGAKENLRDLCDCEENCGGYCAIRVRMSRKVRARVEQYAVADVVTLWGALDHFQGVADDAGLTLGATVGSTAWRSARAMLDLGPPEYPRDAWAAMRRGYYGGRVEVWRQTSDAGHAYDVNSMYPWALATVPFPVTYLGRVYDSAARDYGEGRPGVYTATVDVPESFAPPLPYRAPSGRLTFPHGRLTGSWTANELEHAETCGTRILKVHSGHVFNEARPIFGPWVERLFDLRVKYGKQTREGKWLKLVLNSLSGKLGSRSEARQTLLYPEPGKIRPCECDRPRSCTCAAPRPLDSLGRVWERVIQSTKVESCAHAPWAAYLTAAARVKLHRHLDDSCVYGDTDSQYRESCLPPDVVGDGLGQWADGGEYRGFRALAPKVYRYADSRGEHIAAKGVPTKGVSWSQLEAGEEVEWWSMAGLRRARGEGFFRRVRQTRAIAANTGARFADGPVLTRPPSAADVEAM